MNKAILVMDMPDDCFECNFCIEFAAHDRCVAAGNRIFTIKKPDWCPLTPIPEKYNMDVPHDRDYDMEYEYGYNACIDEILRG